MAGGRQARRIGMLHNGWILLLRYECLNVVFVLPFSRALPVNGHENMASAKETLHNL